MRENLFIYWDNLFASIGKYRFENNIDYVDIFSDFYVGNKKKEEWWKVTWYAFSQWYSGLIPQTKKSFELTSNDRSNPIDSPEGVIKSVAWTRQQILNNKWVEPLRYSVSVYANANWPQSKFAGNAWQAYSALWINLAKASGGINRFRVAEIGISHSIPGVIGGSGQDNSPTNDGQEGEFTFTHAFGSLLSYNPTVPVSVWIYQDAPADYDGLYGLYKKDGKLTRGWWLLPQFF